MLLMNRKKGVGEKCVTFGCQLIKGSVAFLLLFLWITCSRGSQLPFVRAHNSVMENSMD